MEEQVAIVDAIHTAMLQQEFDVFVQFFTHHERMVQPVHQVLFLGSQLIWMLWIDGRKVVSMQRIFFSIQQNGSFFIINIVEQCAVLHLPFRMFLKQFALFLELNNGNGLVHQRCKAERLLVHLFRSTRETRVEFLAWIIAIGLHGKGCQGNEVDAVAFFQCNEVGIP